jgi:hypothetical protein
MLKYAAALENRQITDACWLWRLGDALAKLANKMEPQAAAEIAKGLAAALENPRETDSHRAFEPWQRVGGAGK